MTKHITNEDIHNFVQNRPHVFILGAGASKAALPQGDRYGVECPVMDGFLHKTGLDDILINTPFYFAPDNLESIYSALYDSEQHLEERIALEKGIHSYFESLVIPYTPTVYDYLLLSLRNKDYIFTFNWDDMLIQAYFRVRNITRNLPKIYFLHGNVSMGYCRNCSGVTHIADKVCPKCGRELVPQPLLYPIKHKNYQSNKSIADTWHDFMLIIKNYYCPLNCDGSSPTF